MKPKGSEQKSAVHQRALRDGLTVRQHCNVENRCTVIDYGVPGFTYAYFNSPTGCYQLTMSFDEAVSALLVPDNHSLIERIPTEVVSSGPKRLT